MQPAQAQVWEILDPLPQGSGAYRGHFVDAQNGWVFRTGSSQLMRTRNGGATFTELYLMSGMRNIFMADTLVGYMIVEEDQLKLFKTVDGGASWELNPLNFNFETDWLSAVNALLFINSEVGFVANESTYLKTTDGGLTWLPMILPTNNLRVTNIAFIDDSTGWLTASTSSLFEGYIYHTTDQGANWNYINSVGHVSGLDVLNRDTVLLTGYFRGIVNVYGVAFITVNNFADFSWQNSIIDFRKGLFMSDTTILFYGSNLWTMHIDSTTPIEVTNLPLSIANYSLAQRVPGAIYLTGGSNIAKRADTAYVSIPTQLIYSENVKVYPNPAATSINITMPPNCSSAELYISNIMGQRIFQQTINSDNVADLDISKLPTGVYILTIEGMKNKYYSKFIKR